MSEFPGANALGQALQRRAQSNGSDLALETEQQSMSYRDLLDEAGRRAREITQDGRVRPLVAIRAAHDPETIVSIYACGLLDYPFTTIDHRIGDDRAERIEQLLGPTLMLDGSSVRTAHQTSRTASTRAGSVVLVLATSGTTGLPKFAGVRDQAIDNFMKQTHVYGLERERLLLWAAWSFDAAISDLLIAVATGSTLIIADDDDRVGGPTLATTLERRRITTLTTTPSILSLTHPPDLERLTVISVGEPLPENVAKAWLHSGIRLFNSYGLTETSIWSTYKRVRTSDEARVVGQPIEGVNVHIVSQREELPNSHEGEVWVSGIGVAVDACLPALPAISSISTPHGDVGAYRTGDLGRKRPNGDLELLGRDDGQVKVAGARVELQGVEQALLSHPGVSRVVAMVRGSGQESSLVAYVKGASPGVDAGDLWAHARASLPWYSVPRVVLVDEFELSPNGKVNLTALEELDHSPVLSLGAPTGQASPADQIGEVWDRALGFSCTADADFFESGGNSLKAATIVSAISKQVGTRVSIRELYEARTKRQFIEHALKRLVANDAH